MFQPMKKLHASSVFGVTKKTQVTTGQHFTTIITAREHNTTQRVPSSSASGDS
jgi:hypothetical protein